MTPGNPHYAIDVEYTVRRTVYVLANTEPEARQLALDPANWSGAEEPVELFETLRLVGQA